MDGQDNMKERLLVLSQRMARRKSPKQKKRTLYQLSEMFSALGYRVTLMGKKGIHGQLLLGGDPSHAKVIVAADFNLREARLIPARQQLLNQSANRRNQLDNLTVSLVLTVLLAIMGVLLARLLAGPAAGRGQCREKRGDVCVVGMCPAISERAGCFLLSGRNGNRIGAQAAA